MSTDMEWASLLELHRSASVTRYKIQSDKILRYFSYKRCITLCAKLRMNELLKCIDGKANEGTIVAAALIIRNSQID